MKKLATLGFAALALFGMLNSAFAFEYTQQYQLRPLGYCQLSVTTAVSPSTCPNGIPYGTLWALVCIETASVRWRDDGTAPTASIGQPTPAGNCQNFYTNFQTLQFIAQSGTATVNISFYQ